MPYKPKTLLSKKNKTRKKEKRDSASIRGYNYRWTKAREQYLINHPLCRCEECIANNKLTTANVIHHVIEHKGDYELFWDQNNWLAMNKACHDRHHMKEKRRSK
jgi:5-methylcytosine-specific restriction protein A